MSKQILIDAVCKDEIRVASIQNNKIIQLEQSSIIRKRLKKNIYLGVVTNVEPSLQAAFINYGCDKTGFLSFSDIVPNYYQINTHEKDSILNNQPEDLLKRYKIQDVIHAGQQILVQVTKEERGNKGVSFTTQINIAGKYFVIIPYSKHRSISKQITNAEERKRLSAIVNKLDNKGIGIILRKSAVGKNEKNIVSEYKYLSNLWANIQCDISTTTAPSLVSDHNDIIQKLLCDLVNDEKDLVLVDGHEYYKEIKERAKIIMPHDKLNIKLYRRITPILEHYKVEKQIAELYQNRATLPSGGYIIINPTEALVAIDINSGKMTNGADVEETAYKTNLEAAHEIARQVELRGLSGLIVIDFIDMVKYKNCRLIKLAVEEAFRSFNCFVQISEISTFGLMEVSKQRTKKSIFESNASTCSHCNGSGYVQSHESTFLRALKAIYHYNSGKIEVHMTQQMALYILNNHYSRISTIEEELNIKIHILVDSSLAEGEFQINKAKDSKNYINNKNKDNKQETDKKTTKLWLTSWLQRFFK